MNSYQSHLPLRTMIGQSSSQLSPSSKNTNNKNGRSDENGTDNGNGNGNGNGLHLLPDSSASASASSSSRSRPTSPHPHNLQRLMSESDTEMIIPRTPRPKALTPSPPRTRMGTPDGELDSMVLLRTLDFAARVSGGLVWRPFGQRVEWLYLWLGHT